MGVPLGPGARRLPACCGRPKEGLPRKPKSDAFCPSRINSPRQRDIRDRWKFVTACDLLGIFPLHNVRYWVAAEGTPEHGIRHA